jgi:EAL domain-containing protein (putative c-di-GMP-specific phosphodiesterase class I)
MPYVKIAPVSVDGYSHEFAQKNQLDFDFGKIAVNISAVELINLDLANKIINQINSTGAQKECIEVEITESALMKTPEIATKVMSQLVEAGILIAIDDFGTGYSSLSYMKNLPASFIKIQVNQFYSRNIHGYFAKIKIKL